MKHKPAHNYNPLAKKPKKKPPAKKIAIAVAAFMGIGAVIAQAAKKGDQR